MAVIQGRFNRWAQVRRYREALDDGLVMYHTVGGPLVTPPGLEPHQLRRLRVLAVASGVADTDDGYGDLVWSEVPNEGGLVAAGGWCAPTEDLYRLPEAWETADRWYDGWPDRYDLLAPWLRRAVDAGVLLRERARRSWRGAVAGARWTPATDGDDW